jgi:penicillin-binding protein 1B
MRELDSVPGSVLKKRLKRPKKEMRLRIPRGSGLTRVILGPAGRIVLIVFAVLVVLTLGTFTFFYAKYSRLIDVKLRAGVFANTAKIYGAPRSVAVGDVTTPADLANELRRSGYNESRGNSVGYFLVHPSFLEIFPGTESYFDQEAGVIRFTRGRISQIVSLQDNTARNQYQLEPQLITALSGPSREKRRMVKFHDIPRVLVDALTSAEDQRFFQHNGFDPIGIIRAAYADVREGRKGQGASTLSMQLARMFWLDQNKAWTRKAAELIITLQLEQKLSKQEIFEDYANQIYLGWRGSFRIRGFGAAADAFLGKDLSQVTLPEAAELAGIPPSPSRYDPFRHPDHLRDRRNVVLGLMRRNGFITDREYALAIEAPLTVAKGTVQSAEAPNFVDMVNEDMQTRFQDSDLQSNGFRIYTTLDMDLQRAAAEAVRLGMANVDELIKKQRRFKGQTPPEAQVALVALDPHTGEIKALVGGRNYGMSQLNHVLAKRQPGSIFKPFVYAAAMDMAVEGRPQPLTPASIVIDEPTTFWFDGKPYEPGNFEHEFSGPVTLRQALAHSLNVATVKVAEQVGYGKVVEMANRAGMNYKIQPTPAVALGAYEITPVEAAGAYTMFSNAGDYIKPSFLSMVRDDKGRVVYKNKIEGKQVLDPRVAYLMTSMMEEVLRSGTAAGVRAKYGLTVPAAGKTGTSHDGWFAGYTSELLCVVWVGFDDNKTIDLQGAHSAAPIWAEFMKRALGYREYRDAKSFRAPAGIVSVEIDPGTGMVATPSCPLKRAEVFIAGTEPLEACTRHGGGRIDVTNVSGWDTSAPPAIKPPTANAAPGATGSQGDGQVSPAEMARRAARQAPPSPSDSEAAQTPKPEPKKEKKGILHRIFGVFK